MYSESHKVALCQDAIWASFAVLKRLLGVAIDVGFVIGMRAAVSGIGNAQRGELGMARRKGMTEHKAHLRWYLGSYSVSAIGTCSKRRIA